MIIGIIIAIILFAICIIIIIKHGHKKYKTGVLLNNCECSGKIKKPVTKFEPEATKTVTTTVTNIEAVEQFENDFENEPSKMNKTYTRKLSK